MSEEKAKKTRRVPYGTFQSADGKTISEQTYARTITRDGVEYKRVPEPKPKSRADRLSDIKSDIENAANELRDLADSAGELNDDEIREQALAVINAIEWGDLEELMSEMESWRDNMSSANMEHLPKYDEVSEAYDNLESMKDELEGIDLDLPEINTETHDHDTFIDAINTLADELENAASNYDVDFPGMF
jgi:chromosome segregation ATPase